MIDLIHLIQDSNVPIQLKEDILMRDVQFESNIKVKTESIQINIDSEEVLIQKLKKIFESGFIIDMKSKNPLKGFKITFSLANNRIIISIARYERDNYIIVSARGL